MLLISQNKKTCHLHLALKKTTINAIIATDYDIFWYIVIDTFEDKSYTFSVVHHRSELEVVRDNTKRDVEDT
jgi:hypothetical protein